MMGLYTENIIDNKKEEIKGIVEAVVKLCLPSITVEQFHEKSEDFDRAYDVYQITIENKSYILKKSNAYEIGVYETFLVNKDLPVPKYMGSTLVGKEKWILLSYIAGKDLRDFSKEVAIGCADSLTKISNMYWQNDEFDKRKMDDRFERYCTRINKRAECLKNESELAKAY